MKRILVSIALVFAVSQSFAISAPKCSETFCNAIATEISSTSTVAIEGMKVRYGNLTFTVPQNPTFVASFGDTDTLVIKYGQDKKVLFGTVTGLDSLFITTPKNLTLFDWADIVFTKTTHDPLPTLLEDKEAWLWTLQAKATYFAETGENVLFFRKGYVTTYVFSGDNIPFDYGVFITSEKNKDMLIDLSFDEFSFNEVKAILTSMRIEE